MRVNAIALLMLLGGCATLFSGSTQAISVNSNVAGAEVFLDGERLGTTPIRLEVDRGLEGTLAVRAPGYKTYEFDLETSINPLFWLNLFFSGSFSSSTDWSSGAMYEYEPGTYFAVLQPSDPTASVRRAWRHREILRAFVLLNSEALVSDLSVGEGEYVDTLFRLLDVKSQRRDDAIDRWRARYAAADTATEFADGFVAELHSK